MLITWEIPRFQFPFLRTRRKNWSNSLYNIHSLSTSVLRSKPLYQLLKLSFWRQFCICMHPSELFLMLLLYVGCLCSWGRGGCLQNFCVFPSSYIVLVMYPFLSTPHLEERQSLFSKLIVLCLSRRSHLCIGFSQLRIFLAHFSFKF